MANEKQLIDFETARKNVMNILAGKVSTPVAVKVAVAMQEATVDAVEVVRCKSCKKWGGVVYGGRCKQWSEPISGVVVYTSADDFCSSGERNAP